MGRRQGGVGEASPLCFFPRVQSEDASPTSHGRRPIFIATPWAGASWLFFGVALSTRISKIWVFVRALKKQPTDFRQSTSYFGDRTLANALEPINLRLTGNKFWPGW